MVLLLVLVGTGNLLLVLLEIDLLLLEIRYSNTVLPLRRMELGV